MNLFRLCLQLPFENKGPVMRLSSSNCSEPPLSRPTPQADEGCFILSVDPGNFNNTYVPGPIPDTWIQLMGKARVCF